MSGSHPLDPLPGHDDGTSASATPTHQGEAVSAGEPAFAIAPADLANLLAHGHWGDADSGNNIDTNFGDAAIYDGHVALALDADALPDIASTLDLLTSSHDLFDVPALDVSGTTDDASSA